LTRTAGAGTSGDSIKGNLNDTDYTTLGTKMSLTVLGTLVDDCSNGADSPDLILTSKKVFNIVKALLPTATMNYSPGTATDLNRSAGVIGGMTGYAGYKKIYYEGIPIIKDAQMNSDNSNDDHLFVLNTDTWDFPMVDMANGNLMKILQSQTKEGITQTGTNYHNWNGFYMKDFMDIYNQGALVTQLKIGGNFICLAPRSNGYLSSVNG
jgi:hypothetical protein